MCHHRGPIHPFAEDRGDDDVETDFEDHDDDSLPSFLNEEASGEFDVLTDGGDERTADDS